MNYVTSWGYVTVGDVFPVNGSAPDYPILTGYAPYTTDNPTFFRFNDYKYDIQQLVNVTSDVDSFRNTSFTSIEELQQAVNGGNFKNMNDNIKWLWGNPYDGGVGFINEDATHVRVVLFWGIYSRAGVFYVDVADIRQPYNVVINRDAEAYEKLAKIPASVKPNGTYDNGIFFVLVASVNGEKVEIDKEHQTLGYVTGLADCCQGYKEEPEGSLSPVYGNVTFFDAPSQQCDDWNNMFCYLTPVDPSWWSLLDPVEELNYAEGRFLQRKLNTLDTKNDFNLYLNNSSIFSGAKPINSAYPNSNSTSKGGYEDQNRYSEPIDDGGLPKEDLLGYGIVNLYKVDKSEMQDLMQFLYADISSNVVDAIKNMMTDPLQAIISAHMVHMNPTISGLEEIKFCGYGTGCQAYAISQQYYEYEWEINIANFYGAFIDYEGTRIKLALPYVGIEEIDPRYFLGGKMTVRYYVDILTGMVIVHVYADTVQKGAKNIELDAPIYVFNGNCILSFPMTSVNWGNTFQSLMNIVGGVASGGVGGGVAQLGGSITKPLAEYKHSGSISSNYGYFGIDKPYVIVEHTEIALPNTLDNEMYYAYAYGYPTEQTYRIKDMLNFRNYDDDNDVGIFFKVEPGTAYVSNIHCTDEEKQEIKRLLEEGVYMWYE